MSSTQDQYSKQQQIEDLKNKIDLITDEILNLKDEAHNLNTKILQKEIALGDTSIGSTAERLEEGKKKLEKLKAEVEESLEIAENLEEGGEEYATELFKKREAILDKEIESLENEIAAKRKLLKPFRTE